MATLALSDSLLLIIAQSCYDLQFLNVSRTHCITDYGICNLTQVCEFQNKIQSVSGNLDKDSMKFYPSSLEYASNHFSGSKEQLLEGIYSVSRSRLCQTLRVIHLDSTSVSRRGISTLLALVDNLAEVGLELDDFLDGIYNEQQQKEDAEIVFPYRNLQFIHVKKLTENRIKTLKLICTKPIIHLNISDIIVSPNDFNNYVAVSCTSLTTFALSRTFHTPALKMSFFLKQCPNL